MEDHNNEFISISIRLEQCILEGSYKQVMDINSKHDKNYKYYLHKFDGAIRFQIARSAEKSYESLKLVDAANLLRLNNAEELSNYIKTEVETIEVKLVS